MGHAYVVLRPDTDPLHGDGAWSCYSECPTLASAKQTANENSAYRLFKQLPGRKWREIHRKHCERMGAYIMPAKF